MKISFMKILQKSRYSNRAVNFCKSYELLPGNKSKLQYDLYTCMKRIIMYSGFLCKDLNLMFN